MAIELVLGIVVAFTVLCYSASWPEQVNFLTSALVAGSFFYCQLVPYFVPDYKVFVILEYVVVLMGALVGGITGILVPVASKGISIGVLLSLLLNLAIASYVPGMLAWITSFEVYVVSGLSLVAIALSAVFEESEQERNKPSKDKLLDWPAKIRSAMIVATAVTMSVDAAFLNYQMYSLAVGVLQFRHLSILSQLLDNFFSLISLLTLWFVVCTGSVVFFQLIPQGIDMSSLLSRKRFFGSTRSRRQPQQHSSLNQASPPAVTGGGIKKSISLANILTSYDLAPSISFTEPERKQRTFEYFTPSAYNYVDEENLPEPLKPFSPLVFSIASSLTTDLGFQLDNGRNQSEHLLLMLFNEFELEDTVYSQPALRLHTKLFQNYNKWCNRMGVSSQLLRDVNRFIVSSDMVIEDLLIFLLIWGEAANLKHMPECLCYLLHKTMIEYQRVRTIHTNNAGFQKQQQQMAQRQSGKGGSSKKHSTAAQERIGSKRYPGYYLDMIVTPLFNVVKAQLNDTSADYVKTYDDLNEFFWSPDCLKYEIFLSSCMKDIENGGNRDHVQSFVEKVSTSAAASGSAKLVPEDLDVAVALSRITKTYVEKRSWLHPLLAVNRVFEWHIITFTLLVSIAFSQYLVWTNTFFLQISSVVFLEVIFFSVVWTCLEVWVKFPYVAMTDAARCGYLLRLSFGYLILVYQSIYYHWSFVEGQSQYLEDNWLYNAAGDGNGLFWWWQYNWISLTACSFYLLSSVLCWFPGIATFFMTWDNDLIQAVLSICYPVSQLYVGKELRPTQWETLRYAAFWTTLIAWKLWFGYNFIIASIAVPTMEMYDDYMNFLDVSFWKTAVLMAALWSSHFMVYIVDMYIWYSVWSAAVGLALAIMDRQGDVRSRQSFQSHFMRAPLVFSQYLLPKLSTLNLESSKHLQNASTASLTDLLVKPNFRKEEVVGKKNKTPSDLTLTREDFVKQMKQRQEKAGVEMKSMRMTKSSNNLADLETDAFVPVKNPAEDNAEGRVADHFSHNPSERLDDINEVRSNRWSIFSEVWNKIIHGMYESDHLSDEERDRFLFTQFDWLSKPVYLPVYLSAGCVHTSIVTYTEMHFYHSRTVSADDKMQLIEEFTRQMSPSTKDALEETWELAVWLLKELLGGEHDNDLTKVTDGLFGWAVNMDLLHCMDASKLLSMVNHLTNVVKTLLVTVKSKSRVSNPVVLGKEDVSLTAATTSISSASSATQSGNSSGGGMKRAVSSGFLNQIADCLKDSEPSVSMIPDTPVFEKLHAFREKQELSDKTRDTVRDELRSLFTELKSSIKGADTAAGSEMTKSLTFMMAQERGFFWSDVYASKKVDLLCQQHKTVLGVLQKLKGLLTLRTADAELECDEAKRRLNYFLNSLFMELPKVPGSRFSKEYTTITPYHSEDIIMTRKDLEAPNQIGISVLLYLQSIHRTEWRNFVKRNNIDTLRIWDEEYEMKVRIWASMRGQTLYRTVEGMMQTEQAIRLYASFETLTVEEIEVLSKVKFNYVVACQIYGQMRKEGNSKADDINYMMAKWSNLRVAYIDWKRTSPRDGDVNYYSVLLKHDPEAPADAKPEKIGGEEIKIREVYRIKLPGSPVLGEGKPENQNHAIIFTRGRYLQAVDMNQAGYFEEALKMRNLLEEFNNGYSILGFKEHIFTGSVSCIANYMAMQELSFVTLGQRVLNIPLRIRQHYGHPDVFNKFFVMTEGGMSKASKGTNLSEDVFAGFNATLRGHTVGFKEYVQVGKGRDVGLQQTYKFEAKLAQGNAEQSLSRDVDRICNRLDFFALLGFYYGGIGHYISTALVMFTLTIVVYIMLSLAIYKQEGVNGRPITPEGPVQLMVAGLGLVQTLPLLVTLTVEKGFGQAVSEVISMFISGGPLYFIFHIQTKYYYFAQTLLAGGAKYRPTGRGFVVNHSPFDENYRFFASSHIYLGFELFVALILFACYTHSSQYAGLTWPLWLAVTSFLLGPFWFNPITFEWDTVKRDYGNFLGWMGELGGAPEQSWDSWWKDDNAFFDSLSLSWKVFLAFQKCSLWAVVAYGVMGHRFYTHRSEQWLVVELILLCVFFFVGHHLIGTMERQLSYPVRRFTGIFISGAVGIAALYIIVMHVHCLRYIVGLYYFSAAVCYLLLLCGGRNYVMPLYKCHDYLVAHCIFVLLTVLTVCQFDWIQTKLLYHNALSKQDVGVTEVLDHVRQSRARDELKELRTKIATQELTIDELKKKLGVDETAAVVPADAAAVSETMPLLSAAGQRSLIAPYRAVEPQPAVIDASFAGLKPARKITSVNGSVQPSPASTPRNQSRSSDGGGLGSAFEKPASRRGSGASVKSNGQDSHPSDLPATGVTSKNARSESEDFTVGAGTSWF